MEILELNTLYSFVEGINSKLDTVDEKSMNLGKEQQKTTKYSTQKNFAEKKWAGVGDPWDNNKKSKRDVIGV